MNPYEHFSKEALKKATDNDPNFPDWVKTELKMIIDAAQTPLELVLSIYAFFGTNPRW